MAKAGKKPLVDEEVDLIFRKLEPYLKRGLSLHKAYLEAQIPSGRESETSLELLNYITSNIGIVDLFNSAIGSYYRGEKQFPVQSYPVML